MHIAISSEVSPRCDNRGAFRRSVDCAACAASASAVEKGAAEEGASGLFGKSFMDLIVSGNGLGINLQSIPPDNRQKLSAEREEGKRGGKQRDAEDSERRRMSGGEWEERELMGESREVLTGRCE